MPYSSGTFTKLYSWATEQATPPIEISKLDTQESDFATALSNCILRDGTGLPTAAIPWNGQDLTGVGNLTAATATFSNTLTAATFVPTSSSVPTNGLYLSAANTPAMASNSTLRWSVNSTGNHTFAAPSSGVAVTINGIAATNTALISGQGTSTGAQYFAFSNTGGNYYLGADGSAGGVVMSGAPAYAMGMASAGAQPLSLGTSNTERIRIGASGNVTINAPSSGTGLTVNGLSGTNTQILSSTGAASSFSSGWNVGIGAAWSLYTSSTDPIIFGTTGAAALSLITNNTARITIGTTGGIQVGSPTGGDKGAGTLNTAGAIYQNGTLIQDSGTFTCGYTGFSSTAGLSTTVTWSRVGSHVILILPAGTGISNATSFTMTGIPAALNPANIQDVVIAAMVDNGSVLSAASVARINGSTIAFYPNAAAGVSSWTASSGKGINGPTVLAYTL